jgi:1-aminocyclopropane-1-carboxylate deaminase/D-cysteine desulfhydrase-like pyridoxal-dependent ACC family enzyme
MPLKERSLTCGHRRYSAGLKATSQPSTTGANAEVVLEEIVLDEGQLGAGYGRRTDDGTRAAELLARTEGILADPIYTAKGLAALVAAVRSGALDGQTVLFWHGGGTPGLFEVLDAD